MQKSRAVFILFFKKQFRKNGATTFIIMTLSISQPNIKIILSILTLRISAHSIVTLIIMTLSIMTISIMTLSIMTLSIMTLSIMTFSITTLSLMTLSIMTLSKTVK